MPNLVEDRRSQPGRRDNSANARRTSYSLASVETSYCSSPLASVRRAPAGYESNFVKTVGVWYPTLPTIPEEEQRWFTPNEVRLIVEAAQGQYKVLFHLAAYSGLRSGELAGLLVQDLDFARGMIRVRRSVWKGMEVAPKTRRGYRDVWIDSATVQMLKEHLGSRSRLRVPVASWYATGKSRHLQADSETALQTHRNHAGRYARLWPRPCESLAAKRCTNGFHQEPGRPFRFADNERLHTFPRTSHGTRLKDWLAKCRLGLTPGTWTQLQRRLTSCTIKQLQVTRS